jgi:hypothetical protein
MMQWNLQAPSQSSVDDVFDAFDLCKKVSSYPLQVNSNSNCHYVCIYSDDLRYNEDEIC